MVFDYRENAEKIAKAVTRFDNLSVSQQLKFLDFVEQEEENKKDLQFENLILPVLQDFAELTASVLIIEKSEETQVITATLKNFHGFDITQSCKCFRSLLIMADYIGLALENDEIVLSLNFDYEKIS